MMAVAHDAFAPVQAAPATTVLDAPLISFGREICGDLAAGLRREWLITNGLGGYASGTLAGINSRRYHGLLVAALTPPVERTVLVGGLIEWAEYDRRRYALSTHEYSNGVVDQHGYRNLQSFALEGALPVWTFALGGALLEKRAWMAYGENTTYITYRVLRGTGAVDLEISPLVTYRDFHALTSGQGWYPNVEQAPCGALIQAFDGARPFWLLADRGSFTPSGVWYWDFHHREERAWPGRPLRPVCRRRVYDQPPAWRELYAGADDRRRRQPGRRARSPPPESANATCSIARTLSGPTQRCSSWCWQPINSLSSGGWEMGVGGWKILPQPPTPISHPPPKR